jgi:hypothetical protein
MKGFSFSPADGAGIPVPEPAVAIGSAHAAMKHRFFLAALVLAVAGIFWWLANREGPAPITVQFLHRTNNSLGQVRYLIAVSNLKRQLVFGEFNGKSFAPPGSLTPAGVNEYNFGRFELRGGSRMVVAWEPPAAQTREAILRYAVRGRLTEWKEWLREKISPGANPGRRLASNSATLVIAIPPE